LYRVILDHYATLGGATHVHVEPVQALMLPEQPGAAVVFKMAATDMQGLRQADLVAPPDLVQHLLHGLNVERVVAQQGAAMVPGVGTAQFHGRLLGLHRDVLTVKKTQD
jgi:hypothetical protein